MRVQLVDPSGDVTPYDHALARALAGQGAEVELLTSPFAYGPVPGDRPYRLTEAFYRRGARIPLESRQRRRVVKLAEHVPDMLRYRRRAKDADVRHFQWLPLEPVDVRLLPPDRPRVMTFHNVRRRGESPRTVSVTLRLAELMDAVVVHSSDTAARLIELGAEEERVHVIHHGAFEHLTHMAGEEPLPPELAAVEGPVVMCFGTIRPYKGVDVLLEAFREVPDAELWIVGRPLAMSMEPLHELARRLPGRVRFVTRYVTDAEAPAFFRRADVVALPYREIDWSGVLSIALAFGKPIVLSELGGFRDLVRDHAAALPVPPEDPAALAAAIRVLLDSPSERRALAERAAAAGAGPFSWDEAARLHMELYRELVR